MEKEPVLRTEKSEKPAGEELKSIKTLRFLLELRMA
jgi:hypothetical protein